MCYGKRNDTFGMFVSAFHWNGIYPTSVNFIQFHSIQNIYTELHSIIRLLIGWLGLDSCFDFCSLNQNINEWHKDNNWNQCEKFIWNQKWKMSGKIWKYLELKWEWKCLESWMRSSILSIHFDILPDFSFVQFWKESSSNQNKNRQLQWAQFYLCVCKM